MSASAEKPQLLIVRVVVGEALNSGTSKWRPTPEMPSAAGSTAVPAPPAVRSALKWLTSRRMPA